MQATGVICLHMKEENIRVGGLNKILFQLDAVPPVTDLHVPNGLHLAGHAP